MTKLIPTKRPQGPTTLLRRAAVVGLLVLLVSAAVVLKALGFIEDEFGMDVYA
jgi:hypothetical protein